jgi:hypothetical protein
MLDHTIQSNGGFSNVVANFYPATSTISNTQTFTSAYKPLCNDVTISGANILSGVYLNSKYISVGQSGLRGINHYQGALYFTSGIPSNSVLSGKAAVKEFNIKITDKTDWKLLFETQYVSNGTNPVPSTTGLALDTEVSPIILIRHKAQENKPFGFARLDNQTISLRTIIVADNEYQKIAACTVIKNLNLVPIPIVQSTPFDSLGNMTGINYNYNQLSFDTSFTPIIMSVKIIDVPQQGDYRNIIRNMALADFEISTIARS